MSGEDKIYPSFHEAQKAIEGTSNEGDGMRVIQRIGRNRWRITEVFYAKQDDKPLTLAERWANIRENWGL